MKKSKIRYELNKKKMATLSIMVGLVGSTTLCFAEPSIKQICTDKSLGVKIVRDDDYENTIFYYFPKFRYKRNAVGELIYEDRALTNGDSKAYHKFRFEIEPYFDDIPGKIACIKEELRREKKLKSISDVEDIKLYPIPATKLTFVLQEFEYDKNQFAKEADHTFDYDKISFSTTEVTDRQYMNKPLKISFKLPTVNGVYEDFMESLKDKVDGVSMDVLIAYKGVKTTNYSKLKVSCSDVAKKVDIGGSLGAGYDTKIAKLKLTGAQVQDAIRESISEASGELITRGSSSFPSDIMTAVVSSCFDKSERLNNRDGGFYGPAGATGTIPTGGNGSIFNNGLSNGFNQLSANSPNLNLRSSAEAVYNKMMDEKMTELRLDNKSFESVTGITQDVTPFSLEGSFNFKKDAWRNTQNIKFKQVGMEDFDGSVAVQTVISLKPVGIESGAKPQNLGTKRITVVSTTSSKRRPFNSGLKVKENELWVLRPQFINFAKSNLITQSHPRPDQKPISYKWQDSYGSPFEALYYRVGEGSEWIKGGERIEINPNEMGEGEVQFFIDKEALFNNIDPLLTRTSGPIFGSWGPDVKVTSFYQIENFFPTFTIEVSGKRLY